jgi:PadR family transcriptional regulator PadR
MNTQLRKGLLETCVLKYLAQQPSYGYGIISAVSEYAPMSESTLYTILKRLENQGCLSTHREEYDGRLRKYYEITKVGDAKLNEFRSEYAEIQPILNYILGGNNGI